MSQMVDYIWSNWIYIAFLAPLFFAMVNIIDIYFVDSLYEDEWDGMIIAALSQILPWGLVLFGLVSFSFPGGTAFGISFFAGALLILSYFFYFRSLFTSNDGVVVTSLWNLSVPLVPLFAWFITSERLTSAQYSGIGLAFLGAGLFTLNKKIQSKQFSKVFYLMLGAVVFLALSMVLQQEAYKLIGDDFWTGFLSFSLGATIVGLTVSFFDTKSTRARFKHIAIMSKKYFIIFAFAEGFNLIGLLFTQRAIDLSPAVSFVATIGSLVPVFVMVLSLGLALIFIVFNASQARNIYREQLTGYKTKLLACCFIGFGIYLIT